MISQSYKQKEKTVKDLVEKIKNSRTFMLVSITNLPSKQFQDIKKSIREHAEVRVAKKNIIKRTIHELDGSAEKLEGSVEDNCAIVISEYEGFELASILAKEKTPATAKAGQVSPEDIEVKEGPTNLPPGPAISELSGLGIQVAVEEGKIAIKQPKVVVKEGEEITEGVASLLQKLDITPFEVGLDPIAIYDVKEDKVFTGVKIDFKEAKENLIGAASKALGFAQKINYYCKKTIGYFLGKANMHAEALNKKVGESSREEEKTEEDKNEEDREGEKTEEKKSGEEKNKEGEKTEEKEKKTEKEGGKEDEGKEDNKEETEEKKGEESNVQEKVNPNGGNK